MPSFRAGGGCAGQGSQVQPALEAGADGKGFAKNSFSQRPLFDLTPAYEAFDVIKFGQSTRDYVLLYEELATHR
eukprot:1145791-Pelagomonas_calceolata.AAC.2